MTDDTRLRAMLPTMLELSDRGAIVLLLSHFGRPKGEIAAGHVDRAAGHAAAPADGPLGAVHRGLPGSGGASARSRRCFRATSDSREYSVSPRRGEERPRACQGDGGARRFYVNDAFSARTAPMPRPRASPISCRASPAARWRRNSRRSSARSAIPSGRSRRWSAAPRSRPSSRCSGIWSARSII